MFTDLNRHATTDHQSSGAEWALLEVRKQINSLEDQLLALKRDEAQRVTALANLREKYQRRDGH
jgi:hypothetical protein